MHSFLVGIPRFSNPRSGRSDRGSRKVFLFSAFGYRIIHWMILHLRLRYRKEPLAFYFTSSKSASVTVSSLPLC